MKMNITTENILALNSCTEGRIWLGNLGAEAAWAKCPRGDWMWWVLQRLDLCSKELSVSFARNCAERAMKYAADAAAGADEARATRNYTGAPERQRQADWLRANFNPFV